MKLVCKNCGNEIKKFVRGWDHVEGIEPPMTRSMEICGKPEPIITRRMKWIIRQLKTNPGAIIRHRRDAFLEKSYYTLEGSTFCYEVTCIMKQKLAALQLIEVIEERSVSKHGKFVTTERDYGLPEEA